MKSDDTLGLLQAMEEKERSRKPGINWLAWIAVLVAALIFGSTIFQWANRVAQVKDQAQAQRAKQDATIDDQRSQLTILRTTLNDFTVRATITQKQIVELRLIVDELKNAAGITDEAGRFLLTLSDQNSVPFGKSQDALTPEQRERLAENLVLLKYARRFPAFEVEIRGHTDDTWDRKSDLSASSKDQNQKLSERRAAAVKQFLVDHQIPGDKIHPIGRGMLWPVGVTAEADDATIREKNQDDAARQRNRRVEVLIKGVDFNVPTEKKK